MKTMQILVTLRVQDHVTFPQVREYTANALVSWQGSLRPPGGYGEGDPGDPMWAAVEQVTVRKAPLLPVVK